MVKQLFFRLALILSALFVLWMWRSLRSGAKPTRLHLRKTPDSGLVDLDDSPRERTLNVFFHYDGVSVDAYETLDLPAGSAKGEVDEAYLKAIAHADPSKKEFLAMAYASIKQAQHW